MRSRDESNRRDFLEAAASVTTIAMLGELFPGRVAAQDADRKASLTPYPAMQIARLDALKLGEPVSFEFPAGHTALLYRLGRVAGGGVGPEQDIVAFAGQCSHMGADLTGAQDHVAKGVCGPCPAHLTTFDLTRHGMVVAGHATVPLPQITLEIQAGSIQATGVIGLLYGCHENPTTVEKQP